MNPYTNLTEALTGLICQGYNTNFSLEDNYLKARSYRYKIYADEFEIENSYLFEDPAPEYSCTIYLVNCQKYNLKGLLLKRHSCTPENISGEMREKLKV